MSFVKIIHNLSFSDLWKHHKIIYTLLSESSLALEFSHFFRWIPLSSFKSRTHSLNKKKNKQNYIYKFNDVFYNANGKEVENFLLTRPIPNARISSRFNPKRFHPVLKRYRAHLGTDYAAPRGTKIYAAGDGVVSFVGTKGGYGKTVTIQHSSGYMTLYAHVNGYAKGIKKGKKVIVYLMER